MAYFDLVLDVCFLLMGVVALIFVTARRKQFDLLLAFPICAAWICKGLRLLCFDWYIIRMDMLKYNGEFIHIHSIASDFSVIVSLMDALIAVLLLAALIRLAIKGLYHHWYKKAIKVLGNKEGRG